ncbi:MAG: serine hydrolase [Bacteroidota bacterium]|nr:serine hydrolase [Bacteroidota bacterium]
MVFRGRLAIFFQICLFLVPFLTSCQFTRYIFWNYADVGDMNKFPADTLRNTGSVFNFAVSPAPVKVTLPGAFAKESNSRSFTEFLDKQKTLAFLVIRNDSIVYEVYFNRYSKSSLIPAFSVTKSFISALTGIALSEGYIKSIDQPVTDFLPGLKDPGMSRVSLRNLLTMRSGIKFDESYNKPWCEAATFYYGTNLPRLTLKLKTLSEPGKSYEYQSGNTQLLGMALEHATGRTLSEYLEEKIWNPLGMESPATWNYDSKRYHQIKAFCCINARARDFARFGRLYLNRGNWQGKSIIPESWVKESLTITNDSKDSQGYPYTYQWRVTPEGNFFAKGILGQFIYVCPQKNIIIVRMGESAGKIVWPELFHQLLDQF